MHREKCISYLKQCYNPEEGAFSGMPKAVCHAASSYAAMLAIVNIGTEEAYDIVDREQMRKFLLKMKNTNNFSLKASENVWDL
jgi:protein farnesyltransferase subunit beta